MDSNILKERKEKIEYFQNSLLEAETNSSLYIETLFKFINFLIEDKQYDLVIKTLEDVINDNTIKSLESRLKVIDKLISILLKIEDFVKLKSLLDHRASFLTKETDLIMQKFYYAVCYEGLENYHEAIKVLLEISDNISNQNLVNKYLKLSMLNLKIADFENANKYYNLAAKFDKNMKNPTFLLAYCDLMIFKKDYFKALEIYEEYFIKTKNRYRYLDRYLNINIELNRLSEAYSFYERHKEIMKRVLSKQSRLQFYKSAVKLMRRLKNYHEEAELIKLIDEIDNSFVQLNNSYDFIINMIKDNYSKSFRRERDIIYGFFNYINKAKLFSKLVFVHLDDDKVKLHHYVKGLLLEKNLEDDYLVSGIYKDLKELKHLSVYGEEKLYEMNSDPFKSEETKYVYLSCLEDFKYLVFYVDTDNFYETKKLFDFVTAIMQKMLVDYQKIGFNESVLTNVIKISDSKGEALILLKENILYLLNNSAKLLLEESRDYLSIDDFQARLVKNVYVDELVNQSELKIRYQGKTLKNINLKIFKDDLDLYILAEEEKQEKALIKYKSYNLIKEETFLEDACIILFNLRNYHEYLQGYNYQKYQDLLNEIFFNLRTNARNYFKNIYIEGMDNLYLTLSTKDKRIIKRITDALLNEFRLKVDIRGSILNVKDRIVRKDLEDLKYLNALTNLEYKILYDNKNFRHNKEVFKTISLNVEKLLAEKTLRLAYQPVVNWRSNCFKYIYVDILNRVLLGNKESLKKVLWANNSEIDWDNLILTQLLKDNRIANFKGEFFVEVSLKTLTDKNAFEKFEKRINNRSFNKSKLIYVIDYQEFKKSKASLAVTKSRLAFKNFSFNFKIGDLNDLNNIGSLIFDHQEIIDDSYEHIINIANNFSVEIIYNHESNTLTKSFLESKEVMLVMGDAYGKYDNLKAVKKLEE